VIVSVAANHSPPKDWCRLFFSQKEVAMASLRPPGLGPIVGHTTHDACRIWIRASDPGDEKAALDENRRTVGVIGVVVRRNQIGRAWYFRLHREFDRTGTFLVGKDVQLGYYEQDYLAQGKEMPETLPRAVGPVALEPDKEYTVRVGTLTVDDPMPNDASLPDWQLIGRLPDIDHIKNELFSSAFEAQECEATFRTFPNPDVIADRLSFLLGSCRYPGLLWKIKHADRIFKPMQRHFQADEELGEAARFTMMCGDQIYADMLNRMLPVMRADTFEEFQQRYVTAYQAPHLRRLMRTATTYMVLDDHEIEDNWTQDRISDTGKHQLFNIAIGAYQSYQWGHGPRTWGQLLYYRFECAGYPVFVLDTRTQRFKDDLPGLEDNHLLGRPSLDIANHPGQVQRLLEWLSDQQKRGGNVPKFIVSSSVFAPNDMKERIAPTPQDSEDADALWGMNLKRRNNSDSWPAYPATRLAILRHVVENRIQNVVFLSGDIHCSNVAEIDFHGSDGVGLKAFSVTSSAFYWPFPFADGDPNNYVHNSREEDQADPFPVQPSNAVMHYRSYGYTQEDNFTRLDIDRGNATLTVRVYDREGEPVEVDNRAGAKTRVNVLQLVGW
jgi:alkaline phosphatase D